jgi:hypothetical protein
MWGNGMPPLLGWTYGCALGETKDGSFWGTNPSIPRPDIDAVLARYAQERMKCDVSHTGYRRFGLNQALQSEGDGAAETNEFPLST